MTAFAAPWSDSEASKRLFSTASAHSGYTPGCRSEWFSAGVGLPTSSEPRADHSYPDALNAALYTALPYCGLRQRRSVLLAPR